ncbi:MAG TPA: radical SAM protein [Thermodesulfobacteriota bacterium]|nr:radical SAM protein [Thermodesulfobacteriota bacterium]
MAESLDLLFIHTPKFSNFYRPFGEYMTVNLLPMGTLSLADLASQKGYKTKILHLGLEWIEKKISSPLDSLRDKEVKVVAIPLHFHPQSYEVMRIAKEIKEKRPDIILLSGGYTASLFHSEILSSFPQLDAIIRGDAEIPLLALMNAVKEGKGWESIPNLTWRKDGEVKENPLSYVASEEDLDRSSYTHLSLLEGKETYIRYLGMPFVWSKGLSKEGNRRHFHLGPPLIPLNIGRGCFGNCTWCGGGAEAQQKVNGRKGVVFRSPEAVANTMAEAVELGYEMFNIAFDPGKEGEKYYLGLFPLLRNKKLRTKVYFESFSLPSERFLQEFANTFILDGSMIALSPESGDERVRHRNKTFTYSNEELMKAISVAEKLKIRADIFFAMGIPGERYPDLSKTSALKREIKRRFKNIGRIWSAPISLEPASPWHLHPEEFGIVSTKQTFADFYQKSSPGQGGLGYSIPDYMRNGKELNPQDFEKILREAKCRDFCSFHPDPTKASDPFWGRLFCRYMSWRSKGGH